MKKKQISFKPKLFLLKNVIAELNEDRSNVILGGATEVNANSEGTCGPCTGPATLVSGCPTLRLSCNTFEVNGRCCMNTGINGPC